MEAQPSGSSINARGDQLQKIALSTRIKALRSTPIVREQGLGSKRFSSRRIVRMCSSERPATSLGDQLQVPVALRRRGLCRALGIAFERGGTMTAASG
jgi:hypothetical protein